jgi:hypothetical protein
MSEFRQILVLNPRFDFLRYYKNQLFTDCEIRVFESEISSEYRVIRAHRAILSNCSAFFENTFTSGMIEAKTGVLEVRGVPYPHLVQIIHYLYSGTIQFVDGAVMPLRDLALNYGIQGLHTMLTEYVQKASSEMLLGFIAQCFDYELVDELRFLEDCVVQHYDSISIQNLSTALDVATFAHVLGKLQGKSLAAKFADLVQFLGSWTCSDEEKAAIAAAFARADPTLRAELQDRGLVPAG